MQRPAQEQSWSVPLLLRAKMSGILAMRPSLILIIKDSFFIG